MNRIKLIILLLLIGLEINAQSLMMGQRIYNGHHVTIENGLSQNTVTTILRAKNGIIWIGTEDGLNRYDSYNLKVFKHSDDDSYSLSNNYIRSLHQDKKGRLWVGTIQGLNLLDETTGRFTHFFHDPKNDNTLSQQAVLDISEDASGKLWIATYHGLTSYDHEKGKFKRYYYSPDGWGLAHDQLNAVMVDSNQDIWVSTEKGLSVIDHKTNLIENILYDETRNDGLREYRVLDIFEDTEGQMWFATEGDGVATLLNRKSRSFKHYRHDDRDSKSLGANIVTRIKQNIDGKLWFATDGAGITTFDKKSNQMNKIIVRDDFSITNAAVKDLLIDGKDRIWLGLYGSGLYVISNNQKAFRYHEYFDSTMLRSKKNAVLSLIEDNDSKIWIGTDGSGLYMHNPSTDEFVGYSHNFKNPASISTNVVKSLAIDNIGNVYAGTYSGGLNILYKNSTKFVHHKHNPFDSSTIRKDHVWSLYYDKETDKLWTGLLNGFNLFDPSTRKFINLEKLSKNPTTKNIPSVFVIIEDSKGYIWAGMRDGGLLKINKNQTIEKYYHNGASGVEGNIKDDNIFDLLEDSKNIIWIGTASNGLWKLNPETDEFTKAENSNKLPEQILSIIEDNNHHLWIGSFNGLTRYNPETGEVRLFDKSDGIIPKEFTYGAKLKSGNGNIYLGCSNGLISFNPQNIKADTTHVSVIFSGLSLFHKEVKVNDDTKLLEKDVDQLTEIYFKASQNVITFHFAALDYNFPKNNRYKYKLEGFDKDWNQIDDDSRTATYTNLPSGTYTFKVKATNSDGHWNTKDKQIIVVISPYWYETLWFRSLALIIFVSILASIYIARIQISENQKKRLKILVEEKTKALNQEKLKAQEASNAKSTFLANMTHELRTPLNGVIGFADLMTKTDLTATQSQYMSIMTQSAKSLLNIVDDILDFSKIEAGKLELVPAKANLINLCKQVADMVRFQANQKKLDLLIYIDPKAPPFIWVDEIRLRQVLINLLSNAVKFTEKGEIELRVEVLSSNDQETRFRFSVRDTGIGISPQNKEKIFEAFAQEDASTTKRFGGTGLGLTISNRLLALMNSKLLLDSAPGKGSTFYFDAVFKTETTPNKHFSSTNNTLNILVADDNEVNRMLLFTILENLFPSVSLFIAEDGEEAIQKYSTEKLDLIFLDLRMPLLNGYEVAEKIRSMEKDNMTRVPIIAVSASNSKSEKEKCLSFGMDNYLNKPITQSMVAEVLLQINLPVLN